MGRPIGIRTFEDKVLQRAVAVVLEGVYEQDFLDCSYGFRPGRSAHQALQRIWKSTMSIGAVVLEVDIQAFFDSLDHGHLRSFLEDTKPVPAPGSSALSLAPAPRVEAEPLTPTITRLHVSVSPAFLEKREAARIALSHSMPGASDEDVLSAGLDLILARDAKRRGWSRNRALRPLKTRPCPARPTSPRR